MRNDGMLNKEMLERLRTAADYQKKAFRALLPPEMEGHLEAIEKELKMMFMEAFAGAFTKCHGAGEGTGADGKEAGKESASREEDAEAVKKVTIE